MYKYFVYTSTLLYIVLMHRTRDMLILDMFIIIVELSTCCELIRKQGGHDSGYGDACFCTKYKYSDVKSYVGILVVVPNS